MENTLVFERLFKRNFSDGHNKDLLEQITNEHPYFSSAQFYLLQQTQSGTEMYAKQAAKTALLFNNPYWLNFQLQQTYLQIPADKQPELYKEIVRESIPEVASIEDPAHKNDNETVTTYQPEQVTETAGERLVHDSTDKKDDGMLMEHQPERVTEITDERLAPDNTDNNDEEGVMENEIEPMKFELKLPVENYSSDQVLSFEPMHLVDYFASQGIKLSEEEQTSDTLGRQLKSFTEWLKTMKKLPAMDKNQPDMAAGKAGEQADLSIQVLAEKSNHEDEVITEPMAEVFAKQGKLGRAIELYQKLSLMNPSKSAYFAAKIEQLKDT